MDEQKAIDEFGKLLEVLDRLMAPGGCPWDQIQTLETIRHSILEEACEVIDAIHENDPYNLIEELGDLLYNILFFCKLAKKEGYFQLDQVILMVREKLIARHPHVFGEVVLHDAEAVMEQWEKIKSSEKNKQSRKSALDGIPKSLPALFYAYKMFSKMRKSAYAIDFQSPIEFNSEEELGKILWQITVAAKQKDLNPEMALRKETTSQEKAFREWEKLL